MLPDQDISGLDANGATQKADHWYVGSRELQLMESMKLVTGMSSENSECLGSTACLINLVLMGDLTTINQKELAFGSRHSSGANIGFVDGHVQFVPETIDVTIWSNIGTRSGGEVLGDF